MLFNSFDFAVFLPTVFVLYWAIPKRLHLARTVVLLVASYVFYGWWDWRFLSLIVISSLVDYFVGRGLASTTAPGKRKALLGCSLVANLGLLGVFKYFNFFSESLAGAFTVLGMPLEPATINVVLPVGISFYTFQTLSYSIDVYRRKLEPTRDLIPFLAYVAFFPQLVAGPIERATSLLPQFYTRKDFAYDPAVDGLRQILWGLFKKVVVADNCAEIVNTIFSNPGGHSGSTLLLGAVLFAFQIYGDFSGYSDIAIGTARLFGFDLMQNFAFPYFSRDIAEFWRRWHISLSSWFRDYLYIPLGGSRGTKLRTVGNTFTIFLVSGFWHGANWTFLVWGLLHALYFLPLLLANRNRTNLHAVSTLLPTGKEFVGMVTTFFLVNIAWVFFRAESVPAAFHYLAGMCSLSLFTVPEVPATKLLFPIALMIALEWVNRKNAHGLCLDGVTVPLAVRWTGYLAIFGLLVVLGGAAQAFIYFQF